MQKRSIAIVTIVAVAAVLGMSAYAFAGWGKGRGGYGNCPGWGGRGGGMMNQGGGQGYLPDNLSDEQLKAIETERQAFRKATEELRSQLYSKELELRSELAKTEPNVETATRLQKEVSSLQAQLDEKRIEHMIKMRKISPEMRQGYGRGYGKGHGSRGGRGGRGMGQGGSYAPCGGAGACW